MKKIKIVSVACSTMLALFLASGDVQAVKENTARIKINPFIKINTTSKKSNVNTLGYTPNQIKHAYGIDKLTESGDGQTIAIIDSYGSPTIEDDLDVFNKKYNLEPSKLTISYPNGKPSATNSYWGLETTLDVEWAHALAPKANILLVVAQSDSIDDLMSAVNYASTQGAKIISMSWGTNEFSDMSMYDKYFSSLDTVYVASSGDTGSGVHWPSVLPNVLSVGGTTLKLNSKGNLIDKETAWVGSGGGISSYIKEPQYQKEYGIDSNNFRTVPDVSFIADPSIGVEIYYNNEWVSTGGTSVGAPAWSSFIALANQYNSIPLSNIQSTIYKLASGKKYTKLFRDIISGSNGSDITNTAHKGYDYVTGLGSPLENELLKNLAN